MRQYGAMFASTRIPRRGADELQKAGARGRSASRHIVVLRGDSFWRVEVLDASGRPLPLEAVEAALRHVVDSSPAAAPPSPSVAALTTAGRDRWAERREELRVASEQNAAALATVDSALFHVRRVIAAQPPRHRHVSAT